MIKNICENEMSERINHISVVSLQSRGLYQILNELSSKSLGIKLTFYLLKQIKHRPKGLQLDFMYKQIVEALNFSNANNDFILIIF